MPVSLPVSGNVLLNKFFFEGSSVARLLANTFMKIELLSCSVVYFLATSVATHAAALHSAAVTAALQALGANVEQSSECKGSARIRR